MLIPFVALLYLFIVYLVLNFIAKKAQQKSAEIPDNFIIHD